MKILPDLDEIKRLRKNLDISQEELGKKVGITQSTISRIESREVDPPYSKVIEIFKFLETERMKKKKSQKKARDLMTKNPINISSKSSIKEAVKLMTKYNISQLPLIEDGKNLGSITAKKIQKIIIDNPELINADIDLIKELPFPEIEDTWDIKDISNLLMNYSAVLVKKNNKYVGIIADADLLQIS